MIICFSERIIPTLKSRFDPAGIKFEVKIAHSKPEIFNLAHYLDYSKYSALIACGGDRTYHELVNGMLLRGDGARLPVALIPTGSNNGHCKSIGITGVQEALQHILDGRVSRFDVMKVTRDGYEENNYTSHRYSISSIIQGFPCDLIKNATYLHMLKYKLFD